MEVGVISARVGGNLLVAAAHTPAKARAPAPKPTANPATWFFMTRVGFKHHWAPQTAMSLVTYGGYGSGSDSDPDHGVSLSPRPSLSLSLHHLPLANYSLSIGGPSEEEHILPAIEVGAA